MPCIHLHNVDVDFQVHLLGTNRLLHPRTFGTLLGGRLNFTGGRRIIVSALSEFSLSLQEGARLGVIGHNGSGKSTLLRILAGIYHPTRGTIHREGLITPVFNISLGLSEDLTGYENIEIGCRLYGMRRREIFSALPDIEEFTELGDYLSLPMRTYSDGMKARLSFAIATARATEILLLDEGIGAGDEGFRGKVASRMNRFVERSRIVVLASHSRELLRQMCSNAIVLERGRTVFEGSVDAAFDFYVGRINS